MIRDQISFNGGEFDGVNSAGFANPIHENWALDAAGKVVHFDAAYLRGYMRGFESAAGYRPACFPA